jgi:UDP-3-O-[3-hydroxymyristoyl] glucosamine N-acyltransferase
MLGTLSDLAARIGGWVVGDGSIVVARVDTVDDATSDTLTFATDEHYYATALASNAGAILVDAAIPLGDRSPKPLLVVENARQALAGLLQMLKPPRPKGPFRHPSAVVEDGAQVAADVYVGANAYVGRNARIASGVTIGPGAHIGNDTSIGEDSWLHPRATVLDGCVIGKRVVMHAGSVIGSEGFGWAFTEGRLQRIPQVGNVVLDDDVEVGANTCIDRAQTGSTRVGEGTKFDNLVQVGHNCRIGKHCAFASLTGLAGSTVVGDFVQVGGQVGFKGHITVGNRVTIAGQTGVWGDVADGAMISGMPARNHRERMKQEVILKRLPKLVARVEALEQRAKKPE